MFDIRGAHDRRHRFHAREIRAGRGRRLAGRRLSERPLVEPIATLEVDCRNELGEAPLWCSDSGRLYWVDVVKPGRVFYWQADSGKLDCWEFDDLVTGLNLIEGGGLLVHGAAQIRSFDPASGALRTEFHLPASVAPMRFNDGACDQAGRLWVGTLRDTLSERAAAPAPDDRIGQILRIRGSDSRAIDAALGCPNGICWSPDASRFYIADSRDGWFYSFRFDLAAGTIADGAAFCHFDDLGVPDGAAVDADGYLWNARWGGGAVVRISPSGLLDRVVRLPVTQPTACCFGGEDRRTLYITSARFALDARQLREQPHAGSVFSVRVEVAGIERPSYGGGEPG